MRKAFAAALLMAFSTSAVAQGSHYVRGYTTRNGTYVAPHRQTNPNSTRLDNWSTRGNVNPYTGQIGTRNPYPSGLNSGKSYGSSSANDEQQSDGSCCKFK